MEFFADWHTHSTYSDGRATIEENILAAVGKGLEQLAITDHGPRNIGAGVRGVEAFLDIREEVRELDRKYETIKVLAGAEANLLDLRGNIDIPSAVADKLDLLIVGLHPYIWPADFAGAWSLVGRNQLARLSSRAREKVRIDNTKALKEAVNSYDVDFISHPDLLMPVDIAELATACVEAETALEINTGHHYDKEELVRAAAGTGVNFVVNSDAHFPETVGELASGGELLTKYQIGPDRVINAR